jgi:hypothetical protein
MLYAPPSVDRLRPGRIETWLHAATDLLRHWGIQAALLLGVVLAAGYFGAPFVLGPVVEADTVVRADFVQSVVASGNVLAPTALENVMSSASRSRAHLR